MLKVAQRPGVNEPTEGSRTIDVYVNSYKLEVSTTMFQYSVAFEPELNPQTEKRTRECFYFIVLFRKINIFIFNLLFKL